MNSKYRALLVLAVVGVAMAFTASTAHAATTLLPGGDFEVDGGGSPYVGNVIIASGGSMPSWTVGGAGQIVNWPILNGPTGLRAPEILNLRTVGLSNNTTSISTDIATVVGATYEVTFDHSMLTVVGDPDFTVTFDLALTGQSNTPYSNSYGDFTLANGVPNSFLTETVQFVASNTTTTLSFISTAENGGGDRGPTIDNVRFDLISLPASAPEPSTLILTLCGLMGLVCGRRRRHRS